MSEAVALAAVIGVAEASRQLGMQTRTLRHWCERAGRTPADAIAVDEWRSLGARAMARASQLLDAGRVSGVQALTMAAIAERNAAKPEPPPEPLTPEEEWGDAVEKALHKRYGRDADLALMVALPWFEEIPQNTVVSIPMLLDHIASLGDDLNAVRDAQIAEDHAANLVIGERARNAALWAARGLPTAECWVRAADGPPGLDEETLALVEAAEQWLRDAAGETALKANPPDIQAQGGDR